MQFELWMPLKTSWAAFISTTPVVSLYPLEMIISAYSPTTLPILYLSLIVVVSGLSIKTINSGLENCSRVATNPSGTKAASK